VKYQNKIFGKFSGISYYCGMSISNIYSSIIPIWKSGSRKGKDKKWIDQKVKEQLYGKRKYKNKKK
jgi:hypothetical protein